MVYYPGQPLMAIVLNKMCRVRNLHPLLNPFDRKCLRNMFTNILVVHIHRTPNVPPHHLKRSSKFLPGHPDGPDDLVRNRETAAAPKAASSCCRFNKSSCVCNTPRSPLWRIQASKSCKLQKQQDSGKLSKTLKRLTNLSKNVPEFLGLSFFVGFIHGSLIELRSPCHFPCGGFPILLPFFHSLWGSKLDFLVGHAIGNHSTPGLVSLYTDNA